MQRFILIALLGLVPLLARAEGGACTIDVQKFCGEVQPGDGRIVKCLKEHEHELSSDCKTKAEDTKSHIKDKAHEIHDACKEDQERFCQGLKPGRRRIVKCLKQKGKEALNPACAKALGL